MLIYSPVLPAQMTMQVLWLLPWKWFVFSHHMWQIILQLLASSLQQFLEKSKDFMGATFLPKHVNSQVSLEPGGFSNASSEKCLSQCTRKL